MVTIGIVGCGAITEKYYAPALKVIENAGLAKIVALFDPHPERASKVGLAFPEAKRLTTFEQLVAEKPAMAIVASPARFHAEQSIALLNRGLFVLCEKPMATSVSEAEAMLQAGKERLAVGLFRRFFPAARLMRDYISAETLGKPISFEFTEGGAFAWPARSGSFFEKSARGGVLMDLGAHMLDLALWWFGEPESVECEDDAMGGLEINSIVRLGYANGLKGVAQLSRDWELPNRYLVRCERGWLAWRVGEANEIEIGANSAGEGLAVRGVVHEANHALIENVTADYHESFVAQLLNCIEAIRSGEKLLAPAEEAIRSVRLTERCYANRKLMTMPWLSEAEMRRARELAAR